MYPKYSVIKWGLLQSTNWYCVVFHFSSKICLLYALDMCFTLWWKIMEHDTVHVMILKNINMYRTNKFDVYIIHIYVYYIL